MRKNFGKTERKVQLRSRISARAQSARALSKPKSHNGAISRPERSSMGRGPTKTFQQDGHWVVKIKKTPIYSCACGNKYLKTRPHQTRCLRCLAYLTVDHR